MDEVNVTGEADVPLTVTVEPDVNPVPVMVIVVLLPAQALCVDKDETVGPCVVKVPNPFVAQTVSLETIAYVSYQYWVHGVSPVKLAVVFVPEMVPATEVPWVGGVKLEEVL